MGITRVADSIQTIQMTYKVDACSLEGKSLSIHSSLRPWSSVREVPVCLEALATSIEAALPLPPQELSCEGMSTHILTRKQAQLGCKDGSCLDHPLASIGTAVDTVP